MWGVLDWLSDISGKIWSLAKYFIPLVAIANLITALVEDWWQGIIATIEEKIASVLESLSVDLTPGQEVAALIAKANVIVPIDVAWHYLLLYLSIASVCVGVKWMRNLVPSVS